MFKKLLSAYLLFLLCISVLPLTAGATPSTPGTSCSATIIKNGDTFVISSVEKTRSVSALVDCEAELSKADMAVGDTVDFDHSQKVDIGDLEEFTVPYDVFSSMGEDGPVVGVHFLTKDIITPDTDANAEEPSFFGSIIAFFANLFSW